jgi:heme-degrading monooxygenase HmoA
MSVEGGGVTINDLTKIGKKLKAADDRRAEVIAAAQEAAKVAVAEGFSEVEVARALGVDRARTPTAVVACSRWMSPTSFGVLA